MGKHEESAVFGVLGCCRRRNNKLMDNISEITKNDFKVAIDEEIFTRYLEKKRDRFDGPA